jgi:hypothetical protein
MNPSRRIPAVAIVVLSAAGVLPARAGAIEIGFGNNLDMGKLRTAIEDNAKAAYAGFPVGKAICPKSRKIKSGDTFTCTLPVSDGVLTIDVVQKDGRGNIRFSARQAVIDLNKARTFVASEILKQTKVKATVDCGTGKVKVIEPKKVLTCVATAPDGDTLKVNLTVKDIDGNVTLSTG